MTDLDGTMCDRIIKSDTDIASVMQVIYYVDAMKSLLFSIINIVQFIDIKRHMTGKPHFVSFISYEALKCSFIGFICSVAIGKIPIILKFEKILTRIVGIMAQWHKSAQINDQ